MSSNLNGSPKPVLSRARSDAWDGAARAWCREWSCRDELSDPGLSLSAGEVHVWRIGLDPTPVEFGNLEAALSDKERSHASHFATRTLGRRWTAAHGALRMILAAYLGSPPDCLLLTTGTHGKPTLAGMDPPLFFNLSHTGHLAFVAVAAEEAVGVDAEIVRPEIEWEELSRRFFAKAEFRQIASLSPEMRRPAFFSCWTRKEAYLKALGLGLFAPLDKFQVTVRPDETPRLLWVEGNPEEVRLWNFRDLSEPGVAAAIAVRQPKITVKRIAFSMPPI